MRDTFSTPRIRPRLYLYPTHPACNGLVDLFSVPTVFHHFRNNLCLLLMVLVMVAIDSQTHAQTPKFTAAHHAWARFKPGAWKKVRITTEAIDENGNVQSTNVTETTTYLTDVTDSSYSLHVDVSVEVAGKRFDTEPQLLDRGLYGELAGDLPEMKNRGAENITIEGQRIPCNVYEYETRSSQRRRVNRIYYNTNLTPHTLRKEVVSTDTTNKRKLFESKEEVIALNMPYKVLSELKPCCLLKTVRQNPKGTTTTIETHSKDVPGAVVAHTSKELDSEGRLIRRSTLELVEYGLESNRRYLRRRGIRKNLRRRNR